MKRKEIVLLVSVDEVTLGRLLALSRACEGHPCAVAASILHDVLEDDCEWNLETMPAVSDARN